MIRSQVSVTSYENVRWSQLFRFEILSANSFCFRHNYSLRSYSTKYVKRVRIHFYSAHPSTTHCRLKCACTHQTTMFCCLSFTVSGNSKKCHICNNWLFCSTFMLFPLGDFYFYMFPLVSFCQHSSLVLFYKSSLLISYLSLYLWQVEVNNNAERTSAAGIPSGGRHCNSTSCSRDTSFPRGSCSKDFFRSGEREET